MEHISSAHQDSKPDKEKTKIRKNITYHKEEEKGEHREETPLKKLKK
jgi:hypothetical protein